MLKLIWAAIKETVIKNKRIFIRFIVSFTVCIVLGVLLCSITAVSAAPNNVTNEPGSGIGDVTDSSALKDLIGVDGSQPLQIILLVTILSIAPALLIMLTSFTRIIICFSFLRSAMQTQSIPPNMVLTGLSLFLTLFIMFPIFAEINETAYSPYAEGKITAEEAINRAGAPLKTFMLKQTTNDDMQFFLTLQKKTLHIEGDGEDVTLENYQDELGFEVVIPAFIVSELKRAFQMGFLIFIPFLVIDIVISSTLMAMGMMMLPPAMISMPFKIMLFVLVDGWQLMIGAIVNSYNL